MNCARKALTILLILLITPMLCGQSLPDMESGVPMITPPPEMQHFTTLPSGELIIFFTEDEWIELSRLLWEDRIDTAKEAVKEAVIPLVAENQVLKQDNRRLRWLAWGGVGVGAAGIVLGILFALQ